MTLIVGSPIPEPMFSRIHDPDTYGLLRARMCKECEQTWMTVEVSIYPKWYPIPANFCPKHEAPAKILTYRNIDYYKVRADKQYPSLGERAAFSIGGVYRRRRCWLCANCAHEEKYHELCHGVKQPDYVRCKPTWRNEQRLCGCKEFVPCLHKGKPHTWTTVEASALGIVVKDVCRCPTCGGVSKILHPKRVAMLRGHMKKQAIKADRKKRALRAF